LADLGDLLGERDLLDLELADLRLVEGTCVTPSPNVTDESAPESRDIGRPKIVRPAPPAPMLTVGE
jgi:hypothetical protein